MCSTAFQVVLDKEKKRNSSKNKVHVITAAVLPGLLLLAFTVLVAAIDAQWEGIWNVESARYKPALLPPCPTIRALSYSN